MTNQSENPFHTVRMFDFSPEGTKPRFDLILHGSRDKHLKWGEFTADMQIVPLRVVQARINFQELDEPLIVFAVVRPEELQHKSKIIEACTRGGHHLRLTKEIQNVIDTLDVLALFK